MTTTTTIDIPPLPDSETISEMDASPDSGLAVGAGSWVLAAPDETPAVWGQGSDVLWAEGEAMIIAGSDGSGKSVLAQNLALRIIENISDPLLDLPVTPRKRVLYLALDRPAQARRSLRRMIGIIDREWLDDRLKVIWQPIDLVESNPELLASLATAAGADTLIVDAVKDVLANPSDEKSGLAMKRAYSIAIAEGIETCLLHHDRKAMQGLNRGAMKLSDLYGSRFITAGAGSVVALNGTSGDPIVELRQLKQPAAEVGPFRVAYDFVTGGVEIHEGSDLWTLVRVSGGLTAGDAAKRLYDTETPTRAEIERARRKLRALTDRGMAHEKPGHGQTPATFWPTSRNDLTHPPPEETAP